MRSGQPSPKPAVVLHALMLPGTVCQPAWQPACTRQQISAASLPRQKPFDQSADTIAPLDPLPLVLRVTWAQQDNA